MEQEDLVYERVGEETTWARVPCVIGHATVACMPPREILPRPKTGTGAATTQTSPLVFELAA